MMSSACCQSEWSAVDSNLWGCWFESVDSLLGSSCLTEWAAFIQHTHTAPTPSLINTYVDHFPRSSALLISVFVCVISIVSISLNPPPPSECIDRRPEAPSAHIDWQDGRCCFTFHRVGRSGGVRGGRGLDGGGVIIMSCVLINTHSEFSSMFTLRGVNIIAVLKCWSGRMMQVRIWGGRSLAACPPGLLRSLQTSSPLQTLKMTMKLIQHTSSHFVFYPVYQF